MHVCNETSSFRLKIRVVLQGFEGLADSIVGAVTVFWYALLTDRAFQMMPTNWAGKKLKCVAVMYSWSEWLSGHTRVQEHRVSKSAGTEMILTRRHRSCAAQVRVDVRAALC